MKRPNRTVRPPPHYRAIPVTYTILCNSSYQLLATEVTQMMHEGYRPHGSMVVEPAVQRDGDSFFYQPMMFAGAST